MSRPAEEAPPSKDQRGAARRGPERGTEVIETTRPSAGGNDGVFRLPLRTPMEALKRGLRARIKTSCDEEVLEQLKVA